MDLVMAASRAVLCLAEGRSPRIGTCHYEPEGSG